MDGGGCLNQRSGLFSQQMLETLLSHEVARVKRYPNPVSILFFALLLPASASDRVVESAQLALIDMLQSRLRDADLPGHYAGNFLVIMPATDGDGARTAAERLLAGFSGSQVTRLAEPFEFSVCVGISSHPGGEDISAARMLSDASGALWEAQRRGPKSIVLAGKPPAAPA
jgi:diguanylate cyclase (GGDEF)-like protein